MEEDKDGYLVNGRVVRSYQLLQLRDALVHLFQGFRLPGYGSILPRPSNLLFGSDRARLRAGPSRTGRFFDKVQFPSTAVATVQTGQPSANTEQAFQHLRRVDFRAVDILKEERV